MKHVPCHSCAKQHIYQPKMYEIKTCYHCRTFFHAIIIQTPIKTTYHCDYQNLVSKLSAILHTENNLGVLLPLNRLNYINNTLQTFQIDCCQFTSHFIKTFIFILVNIQNIACFLSET